MVHTDAVIVGAGPAGAAAAIHLANAGGAVVLVDKATFPRDKCCGDGLTTLALRELESLDVEPGAIVGWADVDEAVLRAPNGRQVTLPLPSGRGRFAAVAPRAELDASLVDLAAKAGATVRLGAAFAALAQTETGVVVELDDGSTVAARHVVAADGMWSPVRRSLGLTRAGDRGEWQAFRQYAGDVTGPASHRLYVWFEPDLLPGYAWSFPLPGGRANVGYGVVRSDGRKGAELRALWHDLLTRPHVVDALGSGASFEDRMLAWPIPAAVTSATLSHGRTMFAGDSAAASDVLTGEGIGQALLMGRLAAAAIAESGDDTAAAPARYERAVRDELFADHRLSAALGRILAHRRGANGALAIVDHSGSWGRTNFARWMFEDEPRAIAVTPRRWHRRFFDRPGAFAPET